MEVVPKKIKCRKSCPNRREENPEEREITYAKTLRRKPTSLK